MSRLPFELGLYFALTGEHMDYDRMSRLGFLNGMTDPNIPNKEFRRKLTEANLFFRNRLLYHSFDQDLSEIEQDLYSTEKENSIRNSIKFEQRYLFHNRRNFFTRFAHNQYKHALYDYANAI